MHCSLFDLSDDLLLHIIQELLYHDELLHQKSLEPHPEYGPPQRDDEFQHHRDLMNWSCTSAYFRNLLAPYIFRDVKLRNDEKSGASVKALLKSPYGDLVRNIYFLGTIPSDTANPGDHDDDDEPLAEGFYKASDDAEEEDEKSITRTLPAVVITLLLDLHQFSNLESLSIGFSYPFDSPFDEYYEDEKPVVARALKALMTTTYETLFRNEIPQLRAVEIRMFVWMFTEPYEGQSFRDFLSHVKHFSLSVRGGDNGAGWGVNTCDEYLECVAKFDKLFFNHLSSATTLSLKAPPEGPIGLEGMRHARLALGKEQMPLLKSFYLEHIFICQELVDFVISHTDTLEHFTLHDCYSSVNGLQDNDAFYWKHFFDALLSAELKHLSHLEIRPYNASLTDDDAMGRSFHTIQTTQAEPDNVQQIRRVLSADAKRRVFGYAHLDDKYGTCYEDDEENEAAFWRGEDQLTFDKLMEKVNGNAAKSTLSLESQNIQQLYYRGQII